MEPRRSTRLKGVPPPPPPAAAKPAPKPKASLIKALKDRLSSEEVLKLIDEGADINEVEKDSSLPFIYFIISMFGKYRAVFYKLLELGIDVNQKIETLQDDTLLLIAIKNSRLIRKDKLDIVKRLIEAGADVNVKEQGTGNTACHLAVMSTDNKIETILALLEVLIKAGANINLRNKDGHSVYTKTLTYRRKSAETVRILEYLEANGANINYYGDPIVGNPLTFASKYRDINSQILLHLIDIGVDVNQKQHDGTTPLLFASYHMKNDVINSLLDHGADIKYKFENMYGPLRFYLYGSTVGVEPDYNIVKKMLEMGASVHDVYTIHPNVTSILATVMTDVILRITPEMKELMCQYADPSNPETQKYCKKPKVVDETPYKGFTKTDVELFNRFFDNPSDFSFCPVCLMVAFRTDGCMYMRHTCKEPYHEELFNLYQFGGKIEWCTLCGRITNGQHHHYVNSLPTDTTKPALAQVLPSNDFRFFDKDCKASGGGGNEEKVRRIHRLLGYACQLQDSVGKISDYEARKELIEEVWIAASARNRDVPVILEKKDFGFPCIFPEDAKPEATPEQVFPDILRPADEKDLVPIRHDPPDNVCLVELGVHEDNRPVWQFQHKQPDGTINKHEGKFICGEDLEAFIRSNTIDGRCFDPACKAKIYPEELKDIVSREFYEVYRTNFNRANAKQAGSGASGGAGAPLLRMIEAGDAMCTAIRKPRGGRRTYRRRKNKTIKRRV